MPKVNRTVLHDSVPTIQEFSTGGVVRTMNDLFRNSDGLWLWDGALPKYVPEHASPELTGGTGDGAWINVGDSRLREELKESAGINLVGGGTASVTESDAGTRFNRIQVLGDVYQLVGVSSADGLVFESGVLYLCVHGLRYELLTNRSTYNWPSDYLELDDCTASVQAVMAAGKHLNLNGAEVACTSVNMLRDISNGTIRALNDTGSCVYVGSNKLYNVVVDAGNHAVRRIVHVQQGSVNPVVQNVEVRNSVGAKNVSGIFIDVANVKNFKVQDVYIRNLVSIPNGIQGDVDGPCRGIIVGTALEPAPTQANVSYGSINGVTAEDMSPWEDCDAVVVQCHSSTGTMLSMPSVTVQNIRTRNVLKRAVKIQAHDVKIDTVTAYCDDPSNAMYAVLSLYGSSKATNIRGYGRILNCVDASGGSSTVDGVYLRATRTGSDTLSGVGAGILVNSGEVVVTNLDSVGTEYIAFISEELGSTNYIELNKVRGQGYSGAIRLKVNKGNRIGKVVVSDIAATSSAENKSAVSVYITNGTVSSFSISKIHRIQTNGNHPDINLSGNVTYAFVNDCVFDSGLSTVGLAMNGGTLVANGISSSGKAYAVQVSSTTNSMINSVNGIVYVRDTVGTKVGLFSGLTTAGTNEGLRALNYPS